MRTFSNNGAGAIGHLQANLDLNLTPYVKINLKLITDLNIKL